MASGSFGRGRVAAMYSKVAERKSPRNTLVRSMSGSRSSLETDTDATFDTESLGRSSQSSARPKTNIEFWIKKEVLTSTESEAPGSSSNTDYYESESEKSDTDKEDEKLHKDKMAKLLDMHFKIPPVEFESANKLTQNDARFQREQFLGQVDEPNSEDEGEFSVTPKLAVEIRHAGGRFLVAPVDESPMTRTQLPLGYRMPICVLCVDSDDVIHCRYYEDDIQDLTPGMKKKTELRIRGYRRLLRDLDTYYNNNQYLCRYKTEQREFPLVDEVVVVKIYRCLQNNRVDAGFTLVKEYQRAKVVSVDEYGAVVDLLDDYGHGLVPFERVFKITRIFTELPIQRFACELNIHPLFRDNKLVHKVLRTIPIQRTWRDYSLNKACLVFDGQYSKNNLPLVDVYVRLITTPSKFVSMTGHILKRMKDYVSPIDRLVGRKDAQALCTVMKIDGGGNLIVKFRNDQEMLAQLEAWMESYLPDYEKQQNQLHLSMDDIILSMGGEKELSKNANQIFVARLPKYSQGRFSVDKMFFRVKLSGYFNFPESDLFRVYCLDYGVERTVNANQLVPLSCLSRDLCYLPPLVFEVHLNRIKNLNIDDEAVQSAFFGNEFRVALVTEWPGQLMAPEVNMEVCGSEDDPVTVSTTKELTGISEVFITRCLATELRAEFMSEILQATSEYVALKDEKEEKFKAFLSEYGDGCTFDGESFQFAYEEEP